MISRASRPPVNVVTMIPTSQHYRVVARTRPLGDSDPVSRLGEDGQPYVDRDVTGLGAGTFDDPEQASDEYTSNDSEDEPYLPQDFRAHELGGSLSPPRDEQWGSPRSRSPPRDQHWESPRSPSPYDRSRAHDAVPLKRHLTGPSGKDTPSSDRSSDGDSDADAEVASINDPGAFREHVRENSPALIPLRPRVTRPRRVESLRSTRHDGRSPGDKHGPRLPVERSRDPLVPRPSPRSVRGDKGPGGSRHDNHISRGPAGAQGRATRRQVPETVVRPATLAPDDVAAGHGHDRRTARAPRREEAGQPSPVGLAEPVRVRGTASEKGHGRTSIKTPRPDADTPPDGGRGSTVAATPKPPVIVTPADLAAGSDDEDVYLIANRNRIKDVSAAPTPHQAVRERGEAGGDPPSSVRVEEPADIPYDVARTHAATPRLVTPRTPAATNMGALPAAVVTAQDVANPFTDEADDLSQDDVDPPYSFGREEFPAEGPLDEGAQSRPTSRRGSTTSRDHYRDDGSDGGWRDRPVGLDRRDQGRETRGRRGSKVSDTEYDSADSSYRGTDRRHRRSRHDHTTTRERSRNESASSRGRSRDRATSTTGRTPKGDNGHAERGRGATSDASRRSSGASVGGRSASESEGPGRRSRDRYEDRRTRTTEDMKRKVAHEDQQLKKMLLCELYKLEHGQPPIMLTDTYTMRDDLSEIRLEYQRAKYEKELAVATRSKWNKFFMANSIAELAVTALAPNIKLRGWCDELTKVQPELEQHFMQRAKKRIGWSRENPTKMVALTTLSQLAMFATPRIIGFAQGLLKKHAKGGPGANVPGAFRARDEGDDGAARADVDDRREREAEQAKRHAFDRHEELERRFNQEARELHRIINNQAEAQEMLTAQIRAMMHLMTKNNAPAEGGTDRVPQQPPPATSGLSGEDLGTTPVLRSRDMPPSTAPSKPALGGNPTGAGYGATTIGTHMSPSTRAPHGTTTSRVEQPEEDHGEDEDDEDDDDDLTEAEIERLRNRPIVAPTGLDVVTEMLGRTASVIASNRYESTQATIPEQFRTRTAPPKPDSAALVPTLDQMMDMPTPTPPPRTRSGRANGTLKAT